MQDRNLFERLVDLSPGMEIWWDSSPVIFENWCKKMLEKADPADRDQLKAQFSRMYDRDNPMRQLFRGVTTNPPLSLQAIKDNPAYWEKVAQGIMAENPDLDKEALFWKLYKTVIKAGSEMYLPLFEASNYREGFISGQVDPRSVFDKDAMIRQAEEIATINPNVMIKVPGSKQGYEVIEYLTAKGIPTNNTLTFILPQLMDCANTVKRGLEIARKNGVDLSKWRSVITHMEGRYGNLGGLKGFAAEEGIELSDGEIRMAELAIFKKAYKYLKDNDMPSKMLSCSLIVGPTVDSQDRIWHLEEKAGADIVVTCPPKFIDQVLFLPGVEKISFENDRILEDIPRDIMDKLMRVPYFERGYAADGYTRDEYNTHPSLERTADVAETRGVIFVMQGTATVQEVIFSLHYVRQVAPGDRAIDINRVAREAFRIGPGQASEVLDQQVVSLGIHLDPRSRVVPRILAGRLLDDACPLLGRRQGHIEACAKTLELARNSDLVTDQHNLPMYLAGAKTDVLEQAHVYRVVEKRMKVEQDVDAGLRDGSNVLENVGGLRIDGLRFERDIQTLQPVRNRPSKQGRVGLASTLQRYGLQHAQHALLVLRFDHDDWRARSQDQFEISTSVHQGMLRQPGSLSM